MKEKALCKFRKMQPKCLVILLAVMMLLASPLQILAADASGTPDVTETPEAPETPETPGITETPEEPEQPVLPKYPSRIKLNRTKAENYYGSTFTLKATITPKEVQYKEVTWSSNNKKVATVSSSGKVKITGDGTAVITAKTANGKAKATCTVTGYMYKLTADKKYVKIGSISGNTRKYRLYNQYFNDDHGHKSYSGGCGCVTAAVAIASSGFGKTYSPEDIHNGTSSQPYSERYALKKIGVSSSLWGKAAMSVRSASQILRDMGIKSVPKYSFDVNKAANEIKEHLKKGKPVLVKANNRTHNGIRIANGHHAIVLIGLDQNRYIKFIDPATGRINYAHGNSTYADKMTLDTLLRYHINQPNDSTGAYVLNGTTAGGYILVG